MKIILIYFITFLSFFDLFSQITAPDQPLIGPGSTEYLHEEVQIINGKFNSTGYHIYLPAAPSPSTANVIAYVHGYGQTNPIVKGAWFEHLVKKGNIVIFTRYHETAEDPIITNPLERASNSILAAIDSLQSNMDLVQPILENFALLGHSFGGAIVSRLGIEYAQYNLPKPKAVMSLQPGDIEGITLESYEAYETDIKLLTIVSQIDNVTEQAPGFHILNTSPEDMEYNNLAYLYNDWTGLPAIRAKHEAPLAINDKYNNNQYSIWSIGGVAFSETNAEDYYCFWKLGDALFNCAFENEDCDIAFGDTEAQKYMGEWSNGEAVKPLEVFFRQEPMDTTVTNTIHETSNSLIQIHPNPIVDGRLNILWDSTIKIEKIQLYNLEGRLLGLLNFDESSLTNYRVELGDLPLGKYFIKLSTNHSAHVKRIQVF